MLLFVPQVIDLISLKPFDMETISKSIKKTRKVGQAATVFAAAWPGEVAVAGNQAAQRAAEPPAAPAGCAALTTDCPPPLCRPSLLRSA